MGDAGSASRSQPAGTVPLRPRGARVSSALGITSARRAALLAALIGLLLLSVAVPLRNYLGQRADLAAVYERQHILADKIAELQRRAGLLADPAHIETQARERLRYVRPGQAPYLVQFPPGTVATASGGNVGTTGGHAGEIQASTQVWYGQLWKSINSG